MANRFDFQLASLIQSRALLSSLETNGRYIRKPYTGITPCNQNNIYICWHTARCGTCCWRPEPVCRRPAGSPAGTGRLRQLARLALVHQHVIGLYLDGGAAHAVPEPQQRQRRPQHLVTVSARVCHRAHTHTHSH